MGYEPHTILQHRTQGGDVMLNVLFNRIPDEHVLYMIAVYTVKSITVLHINIVN
jgi:hypothetical protein